MPRSPFVFRSSLALALALGGAFAGCAQSSGEGEEASDDAPQLSVGHDDIVAGWTLEDGFYVSPVLEAPLGATRVGVLLTTIEIDDPGSMTIVPAAMPAVDARAADGEWIAVASDWSEDGVHVGIADLAEPAMGVQIRVDASQLDGLDTLTFNAVIPATPDTFEEQLEPDSIEDVGLATEELRSDLASIGVRSRASWGAVRGRGCSGDSRKYRMAIHHTVSPQRGNLAAFVRGFQRYHMSSNGWCDIGYHFLIGSDGSIFEGRPLELLGAHVLGNNTGNIGIAFIGCFDRVCPASMGSRVPTDAAIQAAARLIRRLSRIYGITVTDRNVLGHRQHPGQSTTCPGQFLLDRLGTIRALARRSSGGGSGPRPQRSCRSDSLGRQVTHGTCVQSSFGGCGRSRCAWFRCTDGAWSCTDLGQCGGSDFPNASCPSGSGQCFDDLHDSAINVGRSGFQACGSGRYQRCTCASGGRWTSCGTCMAP